VGNNTQRSTFPCYDRKQPIAKQKKSNVHKAKGEGQTGNRKVPNPHRPEQVSSGDRDVQNKATVLRSTKGDRARGKHHVLGEKEVTSGQGKEIDGPQRDCTEVRSLAKHKRGYIKGQQKRLLALIGGNLGGS